MIVDQVPRISSFTGNRSKVPFQTLFAPVFSASIIMNLRILEGHSVRDSWEKLCDDYWSIYKRSIQVKF